MNTKKNDYSSNRGGALLSVVIVMTIVAILGTLILSISYTNLRMKVVDRESTDHFYSAEAIMEEIVAGVQGVVSEQYKAAYTTVAENYGNYTTEEEMRKDFETQFVLDLVEAFRVSTDQTKYDIDKLKAFVQTDARKTAVISDTPTIQTLDNGLSLKNVTVSYSDGGYHNKITTDIKILIPDVAFGFISDMPDIADYSIIAQDGLVMTGYGKLEGKAFFGKDESNDNISIALGASSGLNTNDSASTLVVAEGEVSLLAGSELETGQITSFWADTINADGDAGVITVVGRTYVKDDTTLNGKNCELTIGGQYYGYSNDDANAVKSSAIIVNGQSSVIDLSAVDTLAISGTSFVSVTGNENATGDASTLKDVLMGDSIAVKSNQLAYLVPKECYGVVANPMTEAQFTTLTGGDADSEIWKEKIKSSYISSIGRTIGSYETEENPVDIYAVHDSRYGGIVYLFFSFSDSNVASKYFMDYYKGSSQLKNLLDQYVAAFTGTDSTKVTRITTQGNYLIASDSGTNKSTYHSNTGDIAIYAQEMANYQTTFQALCTKLVTNMSAVSSTESGKTVYKNLINDTKIKEVFTSYTNTTDLANIVSSNGGDVLTITAADASATGIKTILVNDIDGSYVFDETGSGIVISTGDLTVQSSSLVAWDGLIICNGTLTVTGATKDAPRVLRADPDAVAKAMQLTCHNGTNAYSVKNFFVGGESYVSGTEGTSSDAANTDVRNLVMYENWKSE